MLLNRRRFLKTSAAGASLLAAPAIISSKALASSGELNFLGWAGYPQLTEVVVPAFEAATGIKVNYRENPDQDTMFAEAKIAASGGGVDLAEPSLDRWAGWHSNGLVQPFDLNKVAMDNYLPGLADVEGAKADGQTYYLPSNWGTESILVNEAEAALSAPPSLGDVFNPANAVTLRPHSALATMGRWLEAQGKLPRPWRDGYSDPAVMVELWDIALAEASKAKANVVQWWSGENEAVAGFEANGAVAGIVWDSTGFNLRNSGYKYLAPVEGAFAWSQGFVLHKGATNIDQAHEFVKYISSPAGAAGWATAFATNPVGKGAADLMDPDVATFYNAAFDEAAVKNLWWWPEQSAEFISKRSEYADKYRAA